MRQLANAPAPRRSLTAPLNGAGVLGGHTPGGPTVALVHQRKNLPGTPGTPRPLRQLADYRHPLTAHRAHVFPRQLASPGMTLPGTQVPSAPAFNDAAHRRIPAPPPCPTRQLASSPGRRLAGLAPVGPRSPPSTRRCRIIDGEVLTNKSSQGRADAQRLVATRLLDRLHDPLGHFSRLQRIYPRAR